jgi:hypothetical protein
VKYLLSNILNVAVGQNVQSVKIAVDEKCRRSKLPSVKNAIGQNSRRSKIASIKMAVGQKFRRSKLPSVKNSVGQNAVGQSCVGQKTWNQIKVPILFILQSKLLNRIEQNCDVFLVDHKQLVISG